MIQKNPFLKYVMKDKKEDVFHSSAYAKVQNGEGIGAASTLGYSARVAIDRNRTTVRGYDESGIMTGAKKNGPHAKVYTPPVKEPGTSTSNGGTGATTTNAAARAMMGVKKPGISIKK